MSSHYIYVNITGGIMGFLPEDIAAFEHELHALTGFIGYWEFFNWAFSDLLEGKEATGFSAAFTDPVTGTNPLPVR